MKNIGKDAVFQKLQNEDFKPYIKYTLQRKVWNIFTQLYDWEDIEDAGIDLNDWVKSSSNPSMALDPTFLNEFKSNNLTLTVRGTTEWMLGGANWSGYVATKSLVKIESGFVDDDGKTYGDKIYQGVIPEAGIKVNIAKGETTIIVVGLDYLFKTTDASRVALTRTDEAIDTGDGTETTFDFPVTYKGVSRIIDVEVDSVAKDESDYEITRLNDPDQAPQIKFNVAPSNLDAITSSYEYWYAGQTLEYLVEAICTATGITNHAIMDAIFPSYSESTETMNTDVHFDAGAFEKTERVDAGADAYVKISDDQTEDFSDLTDEDELPLGWHSEYFQNPVSSTYEGYDGYAKIQTTGSNSIELGGLMSHASPDWSARLSRAWKYFQSPLEADEYISFKFEFFVLTDGDIKFYFNSNKRFWGVVKTGAARIDFYLDGILACSIADAYIGFGTMDNYGGNAEIFVKRVDASTIRVYSLGNEGSAAAQGWNITTDCPIDMIEFSCFGGTSILGTPTHIAPRFYDIKVIGDYIPTGDWTSATLDLGATPSVFGKLTYDIELNGNIAEVYTCSKSSDAGWSDTWSTWTKLSPGNNIMSTPARYLRVRVRLLTNIRYASGTPHINSLIVYHYTGGITVEMADFGGDDGWSAIKKIAKACDYEVGFENQDTEGSTLPLFFFRRKGADDIYDLEITDDNYLIKVLSYDDGYSGVKNRVEVTFGNYKATTDSVTEDDNRPHSIDKYGIRKLSIDLGALLEDDKIAIATDTAETYFEALKNPLYKIKCLCSYLPALEVGDVIYLTSARAGISTDYTKIVYISHDKNKWETTLLLREI